MSGRFGWGWNFENSLSQLLRFFGYAEHYTCKSYELTYHWYKGREGNMKHLAQWLNIGWLYLCSALQYAWKNFKLQNVKPYVCTSSFFKNEKKVLENENQTIVCKKKWRILQGRWWQLKKPKVIKKRQEVITFPKKATSAGGMAVKKS